MSVEFLPVETLTMGRIDSRLKSGRFFAADSAVQ